MIVWNRVRADFLMPSRLDEYARLLRAALDGGYEVMGIERFWRSPPVAPEADAGRRFVVRHDVDTDPGTAEAMWRIEHDLGIAGSWLFRLSTRDDRLMNAIAADGGEVGYHYEEIATIAKERRLRTREAALASLPEARDRFSANLGRMRATTGLPLPIAASHGDFVNRRLGVPNFLILSDLRFRADVGIGLEGYDEDLLARMPVRSTDTAPPTRWRGHDPLDAIQRGEPVVYGLFHPRHWRVARAENARDDARRLWEGVTYLLPTLPRGGASGR